MQGPHGTNSAHRTSTRATLMRVVMQIRQSGDNARMDREGVTPPEKRYFIKVSHHSILHLPAQQLERECAARGTPVEITFPHQVPYGKDCGQPFEERYRDLARAEWLFSVRSAQRCQSWSDCRAHFRHSLEALSRTHQISQSLN